MGGERLKKFAFGTSGWRMMSFVQEEELARKTVTVRLPEGGGRKLGLFESPRARKLSARERRRPQASEPLEWDGPRGSSWKIGAETRTKSLFQWTRSGRFATISVIG